MMIDIATFKDCAEQIRETVNPSDVGEMPYIGLEHINENSLTLNGYGTAAEVESMKFKFKKGDILFGKLRPYFRKVVIAPFDGVCSTDIWVVRSKNGVDQKYLFYWMASQQFVDVAMQGSEGTKMPRAKWEFIARQENQVTDPKDQHKIGCILGTLDDKIELNCKTNETLEAIAKAIFKSWFVDFDPVHAKMAGKKPVGMDDATAALFPDSFEDSELGQIPKDWKIEPLDKVAKFLNGLALQKYPSVGDRYLPVIKIKELNSGITDSTDKASTDIPSEYIIHDGDILFSWSGSLEVIIWLHGIGALNQHLFKVTSERYPKWFNYLWVLYHLNSFRQIAADKATTMGHIQRHHLSEALVLLPPSKLIDSISQIMAPIIENIINNGVMNRSLESIRDLLLPKLISGKIEV